MGRLQARAPELTVIMDIENLVQHPGVCEEYEQCQLMN